MLISSGLYVHPNSQYSVDWVGRALRKQLSWCRDQGIEYDFLASTLGDWSKFANWPESWSFGTLVKFGSIRRFLDDHKRGDLYVWIDLDIYPREEACVWDICGGSKSTFFAPLAQPSYCGFPGPMDPKHYHMYNKLFWAGTYGSSWFNAVNSAIFAMTRADAERFWIWLNRDASIDSPAWWESYRQKQYRCATLVAELGNEGVPEHSFGTEEMFIEEWLNSQNVSFKSIDSSVVKLFGEGDAKFIHYYGSMKNHYPAT